MSGQPVISPPRLDPLRPSASHPRPQQQQQQQQQQPQPQLQQPQYAHLPYYRHQQQQQHHQHYHPHYPNPQPSQSPPHHQYPNTQPFESLAHHQYPNTKPFESLAHHQYPKIKPSESPVHHQYPNPQPSQSPAHPQYPNPQPSQSPAHHQYPNPQPSQSPAHHQYPNPQLSQSPAQHPHNRAPPPVLLTPTQSYPPPTASHPQTPTSTSTSTSIATATATATATPTPTTTLTSMPMSMPTQTQVTVPKNGDSPLLSLPPGPSSSATYPVAIAKHEDVCSNRDLFFDTLNKFHASIGTRLMIPTIGGKELDLHLLYVEVTSRGGLDQVIKERKWKEVTLAFSFPPTTTSASFVLRKYYISLLHHYEQVYCFGNKGQLIPPPIALPTPTSGYQSADNGCSSAPVDATEEPVVKKRGRKQVEPDPIRLCGVDPGTFLGHSVSGVIDGKFEHGYLVSVDLGADKLTGVLYHLPSGSTLPQFASVRGLTNGLAGESDHSPEKRQRRRRRRKDEMPKKDPDAPKPNRSGYNFFFQEQHLRLKALYPDKDKEISKMIGEQWNNLTEEEKAVYQEQGMKDKERYKREMMDYQSGMKPSEQTEEDMEDIAVIGSTQTQQHPFERVIDDKAQNCEQNSNALREAIDSNQSNPQGNHLSISVVVELGNPRPEMKTEERNFWEPPNGQGAYG